MMTDQDTKRLSRKDHRSKLYVRLYDVLIREEEDQQRGDHQTSLQCFNDSAGIKLFCYFSIISSTNQIAPVSKVVAQDKKWQLGIKISFFNFLNFQIYSFGFIWEMPKPLKQSVGGWRRQDGVYVFLRPDFRNFLEVFQKVWVSNNQATI